MNNGNEERALIKNLKFLDGKLNIKLEWPNINGSFILLLFD